MGMDGRQDGEVEKRECELELVTRSRREGGRVLIERSAGTEMW